VELGHKFAALGKHILMDKPAGICAGEVEELVRYCDDQGIAFSVIFNNRQLPAYKRVKEILDQKLLGTLHRAVWVCNDWYRSPAYHASAGWRSSWAGECGGMMVNQNPHYLDMWNWFFGLPDKVYAALEFGRYNDFQVDDAADVQFYYNSGLHGTMVSATGEAPGVNRLEIWGSKGKLTVEDGTKLTFDENEVSTETFAVTNQEIFTALPHKSREIPLDAAGIPYQQVLSRFAAAVLKDTAPVADGMDGLREVQLANAVYVSGWEERRVALPVENDRFLAGLTKRQAQERGE
jgi:predicted dehydrogenase